MAEAAAALAAGSGLARLTLRQHSSGGESTLCGLFLSGGFSEAASLLPPSLSLPISLSWPTADAERFNSIVSTFSSSSSSSSADRQDSDFSAAASRMLFPSATQEPPRGLPDINDLGLGLQSLSLSGWDRPWSNQENEPVPQANSSSSEYTAQSR